MKHLKLYEESNREPQIGDYVICSEDTINDEREEFLSKNIGIIVNNNFITSETYKYLIKYENIPTILQDWFEDAKQHGYINCRRMSENEIIYFSSNKEDLEVYIEANKYNL